MTQALHANLLVLSSGAGLTFNEAMIAAADVIVGTPSTGISRTYNEAVIDLAQALSGEAMSTCSGAMAYLEANAGGLSAP